MIPVVYTVDFIQANFFSHQNSYSHYLHMLFEFVECYFGFNIFPMRITRTISEVIHVDNAP